jgi:hypothetical protein
MSHVLHDDALALLLGFLPPSDLVRVAAACPALVERVEPFARLLAASRAHAEWLVEATDRQFVHEWRMKKEREKKERGENGEEESEGEKKKEEEKEADSPKSGSQVKLFVLLMSARRARARGRRCGSPGPGWAP